MTTEQLPAGPELDVQVQRVVFRTKIKSIRCPNDNPDWPMYIPSGKPWRTHAIDAIPVPKYSTSIEAAWTVVEQMCEHYVFELRAGSADSLYLARFYGSWAASVVEAIAETAPLAICRAALSAAAPSATTTDSSPR